MTATGADVEALLASVGVPPAPEVPVRLEGHDPVLASPFPVGEASAAALAACGAMAARLARSHRRGAGPTRVAAPMTLAPVAAPRSLVPSGHRNGPRSADQQPEGTIES